MFDICPTKYKCDCGGEIDRYIDEKNINNFYFQCRKCSAKYLHLKALTKEE